MSAQAARKSSCLLENLFRRSLVGKIFPDTPEYEAKLKHLLKQPRAVYAGFDATAGSLHIGNLSTIMNLLHFHSHGHKVICVIGDSTTRLGDPSGHTEDRKEIAKETLLKNASSIEETLIRLFKNFDLYFNNELKEKGTKNPIIIRNSMWYKNRDMIEFVSDIFRQVRVKSLLKRKTIAERLAPDSDGINMSEFCYQNFSSIRLVRIKTIV